MLSGILILTFLSSCEKAIVIDLPGAEPLTVIEATLTDNPPVCVVRISETRGFYDQNPPESKDQAQITILSPSGKTDTVPAAGDGVYILSGFKPGENQTYRLNISTGKNFYSAFSTYHPPVFPDSVALVMTEGSPVADAGLKTKCFFTDPPETSNYYRIHLLVNDTLRTSGIYYLYSDEGRNGEPVNYILFKNPVQKGDRVKVQIVSIDKATYTYLRQLSDLVTGQLLGGTSAPANPESNFSGGALGYFGAMAVTISTEYIIE